MKLKEFLTTKTQENELCLIRAGYDDYYCNIDRENDFINTLPESLLNSNVEYTRWSIIRFSGKNGNSQLIEIHEIFITSENLNKNIKEEDFIDE